MAEVERLAARMVCAGFDGTAVNDHLREMIARGVSAFILFTRNYEDAAQLRTMCAEIKALAARPILIGVDQEGGRVQRFRAGFTAIPSMRDLGGRASPSEVREVGRLLARELRSVNIDMNLAPVLDVDSNPANPVIGERSFGGDPERVAKLGCAMIAGLQGEWDAEHQAVPPGVAACGKHFPGHGDTSVDSHLDLPRLPHDMSRLERVELPPFKAAIDVGVAAIMTSHVLFEAIDPRRPATMSQAVIEGLLRNRLGFQGLVLSDDLEMKAVLEHYGIPETTAQAASAGVDLLCVCSRQDLQHQAIDALINATERGDVSMERLAQANRRLDVVMRHFVRPCERD